MQHSLTKLMQDMIYALSYCLISKAVPVHISFLSIGQYLLMLGLAGRKAGRNKNWRECHKWRVR